MGRIHVRKRKGSRGKKRWMGKKEHIVIPVTTFLPHPRFTFTGTYNRALQGIYFLVGLARKWIDGTFILVQAPEWTPFF